MEQTRHRAKCLFFDLGVNAAAPYLQATRCDCHPTELRVVQLLSLYTGQVTAQSWHTRPLCCSLSHGRWLLASRWIISSLAVTPHNPRATAVGGKTLNLQDSASESETDVVFWRQLSHRAMMPWIQGTVTGHPGGRIHEVQCDTREECSLDLWCNLMLEELPHY
jgi:hypothetical protein